MSSDPAVTATTEEERELIAKAQRDPTAFTTIYRCHLDRVYRYLHYRVGNEQDAQDLTTQTFLAALEGLQRYRGEGSVASWVLGIAHHKLVDYHRKERGTVPLTTARGLAQPITSDQRFSDSR